MPFREIKCQERAIGLLQKAYAGDRIAHAYIFAGQDGVGKFLAAKSWAKLLLCEKPVCGDNDLFDACDECDSCRLFEADSHPDFECVYKELIEFTKEGKGRTTPIDLPIDVIREFLIDKVSMKPTVSAQRVFIVTEAQKLNQNSQNALLKVLEEPPAYCCIVLICSREEKLLATTKSRCRIVRFGPVDEDVIIAKITEKGLDKKTATYFGRLASGSIGQACDLAELELAGAEIFNKKRAIINDIANLKQADVVDKAAELLELSKQITDELGNIEQKVSKSDLSRRAMKLIIEVIISALHDAMIAEICDDGQIVNLDQKSQINKLASGLGAEKSAELISACYQAIEWIEAGVNDKLNFEQLLLRLSGSDIMMGL